MGIAVAVACVLVVAFVVVYFRTPFSAYPCHVVDIDVTGRRAAPMANEIEQYIRRHGFREFERQDVMVTQWRGDCIGRACDSPFREHRLRQYQKLDDSLSPFKFRLVRRRTQYQRSSRGKMPYNVTDVESEFACSFDYLKERCYALRAGGIRNPHGDNRVRISTR